MTQRAKKRKLARQYAEYVRIAAMPPGQQGRLMRARLANGRLRRCLGPWAAKVKEL